jgi:hypothetical protein
VSVDACECCTCGGKRLPTLTKQPCRNRTNVVAALCSCSALKCRERTRVKMVWSKPQALFFHVLAWGKSLCRTVSNPKSDAKTTTKGPHAPLTFAASIGV